MHNLAVAAALAAAALSVPAPAEALTGFTTVQTTYGPDAAQQLTIYVPTAPGPHRAVLFIHGGCWERGGLFAGELTVAQRIAQRTGYIVAAMTYRTAQPRYTTMPADVGAALQKLQNGGYGVIRNRVAVWGESAGAHLGLLHALKGTGPAGSNRPRVAISVSGPTNMVTEYASAARRCVADFEGGPLSPALRDRYTRTSPTHWVDPSDPAVLLATSAADALVPPSQAGDLASRLRLNRIANRVVTVAGSAHGTALEDVTTAGGQTVLETGIGFLRDHL